MSTCAPLTIRETHSFVSAAHASSPATTEALLHELASSQPMILQRITNSVPGMLPKAYRWVGEMEEISQFVEDGSKRAGSDVEGVGQIHLGLARLYERITKAVEGQEGATGDVKVLKDFVEEAKQTLSKSTPN